MEKSLNTVKDFYISLKYAKVINFFTIVAAVIILFGGFLFLISDFSKSGDPRGVESFIFLLVIILPLDIIIFIPWTIWFVSHNLKHDFKAIKNKLYIMIITMVTFLYTLIHLLAIILLNS